MRSDLAVIETWGTLHQVWFVRNYYCLLFEDYQRISVYCDSEIECCNGVVVRHGQVGFADMILGCIDSSVGPVKYKKGKFLQISMNNGSTIRLLLTPNHTHGPEAFEIQDEPKLAPVYVEFNA